MQKYNSYEIMSECEENYTRTYVSTVTLKRVYHYKPLKHPLSVLLEIEAKQLKGVSNRQIGRELGIDPQCLNRLMAKWKRGKNPPAPEPEVAEQEGDPELEAYIADLLS